MIKYATYILLFFAITESYSQGNSYSKSLENDEASAKKLSTTHTMSKEVELHKLSILREDLVAIGLPQVKEGEELIMHSAMALVYDENHEQAKWVAHIISPEIINGNVSRTNDFRPDPMVKTGSSEEKDYFIKNTKANGSVEYDGFGYDRGHLAPSADFKWSPIALSESYYYSNISPQAPDFNRGGWAKLEKLLRAYLYENPNTQLYVVTGGVLKGRMSKIHQGVNQVSIPNKFFKVVLDYENKRGIAFIIDNLKLEYPVEYFATSIDEVEKITGINFFEKLPDDEEESIEATNDIYQWLTQDNTYHKPLEENILPKNAVNTLGARAYMDTDKKITVCGTVVSINTSESGTVFLSFDKKFPDEMFTAIVFPSDSKNFKIDFKELIGKKVSVTGRVSGQEGKPSMVLNKEKDIAYIE